MATSIPFQQDFTWRKLGYLYFTDSLSYREVLGQNPQWKVTELPPIGAQLRISGPANGNGNAGGLTQGSFIFGLPTGEQRDAIYPFDTTESYVESLNRYTVQGVVDRDSINGVCLDSTSSITGIQ